MLMQGWLDCNPLVCTSKASMPLHDFSDKMTISDLESFEQNLSKEVADHILVACHLCCPCLCRPVKCMVPASPVL